MSAAAPDSRLASPTRGIGVSWRLAIQLAVLAGVVTAAAAWISLTLVRSAFERQLSAELDRMERTAALALDDEASRGAGVLEAVEAYLLHRDPALLEQLIRGRQDAADAATALFLSWDLDDLELLDAGGTVLASARGPGRRGLRDSRRIAPRSGSSELEWVETADGPRPGYALTRSLAVGSLRLTLFGSRGLDRNFLERVAGHEAALLVGGPRTPPLASARAAAFDLQFLRDALERTPAGGPLGFVTGESGDRWEARSVLLGTGTGDRQAALVLAVNHSRLSPRLTGLGRGFLLLGIAAVVLSAVAGLLIGRGISRPVRELVRTFDAIATGEADYSFPDASRDELQELMAAVSRLHRSLEFQRRRSSAAERVATWRDVARHVAHEVKNPLVPIRLTVENLVRAREQAPERFDSMFRDGMTTILEEVDQLRRMVEEFSAFARLPLPVLRVENLEQRLAAILDLYANDPRVRVIRQPSEPLPPLPLDADQISLALKNVVGNAVEAAADPPRDAPGRVEVRTSVEDGMVCVEVSDDGAGFTGEAERRVFEPYFTTKPGGTGLGMALTYRIVAEHGGAISTENLAGGGAKVTLQLPLDPGGPERSPAGRT